MLSQNKALLNDECKSVQINPRKDTMGETLGEAFVTNKKKASALDRVNVRRLLIAAKKFVASSTKFLVFENNTAATRNRFLSIVNPYFENVQQRQGLFAFKVVMDETNNTPDVIDRNEMRGAIYLQPAKTAEFIIIDFNILPTGASFPE